MTKPSGHTVNAIVSLDLHGYSRLTEQDEIGTHRALMACRTSLLAPIVQVFEGEIVKSTGDGALLRFPDASLAVEAMTRFQRAVDEAEAIHPEARRLVFRIGIHIAPIFEEAGDIYGHGVNLAVRLQEIAEPGSIVLSEAVVCRLGTARRRTLQDLGVLQLKNIDEHVHVHRWRPPTDRGQAGYLPRFGQLAAALVIIGLIIPRAVQDDRAGADEQAPEANARDIAVDERPAMASADADPTGDTPRDVWVQPYPGLASGPLDVNAATMAVAAERSVQSRIEIAEDAYIQALAHYGRHTPSAFVQALGELEHALMLKPDYAAAHALLAAVYWGGLQNRWQPGQGLSRAEMQNRARHHMAQAEGPDPLLHMVASEMLTAAGRHGAAIDEAQHAIALAPERAVGHYAKGRALLFAGHLQEAEALLRKAIRINPHAPRYLFDLALAQFGMDRFDDARRTLTRAVARNGDDDWLHLLLAATSGFLGRHDEARQALGRFDQLSVRRRGWFASQIPYVLDWPFRHRRDRDRIHQGMVLAGLPRPSPLGK